MTHSMGIADELLYAKGEAVIVSRADDAIDQILRSSGRIAVLGIKPAALFTMPLVAALMVLLGCHGAPSPFTAAAAAAKN